jgi:L-Ala-D/L-Glu epimerase
MLKLNYYSYNLAFKYPFTTARGTKTHQPTLVVELEYMGIKAYGEAPAIVYYDVTVDSMIADLESKRTVIERYAFQEPERFWHFLHHLFPKNSFLVCALDMAGWDLYGKMRNKPLYKLWNIEPNATMVTDYTIGMDSIDKMVEKMKETPWPIYKVKMGGAEDIAMIRALRKETDKPIRVDVNSGWTVAEALEKIPMLKDLGIELVEEPITRFDYAGMAVLKAQSLLPLMADESCVHEKDVAICAPVYDGINIKLTKCSGITPAIRMIEHARKLGLKVMVGCMNESTIGSAAIAHLQPLIDYVDMDGPLLLSEDIATGLIYDYGKVTVSDKPGLGIDFLGEIKSLVYRL